MKIGLMTVHHAYNFGAMLQAYATYQILTNLGHEVEVIDYDNPTFAAERHVFLPVNGIGNLLRNIRSLLQYYQLKERIQLYEKFYKKLKISSTRYDGSSIGDVSDYDVIITGSDQTFSLYHTENREDMRPFFLEKNRNSRKTSYASSMGEKFFKLKSEDIDWMIACFQEFEHISVRDKKSADFIEALIGKRPSIVLDPTFQLTAEQWSKEATETRYSKGDYIVFYTVLSEPWVIKYVKAFAAKTRLKVIALHPRTRYDIGTHFDYIAALGPGEFISIIKHAKYIITTSFHATVFSIIFKKQFVSLKIGEGNRLTSLLESFQLQKQLVIESRDFHFEMLEAPIDYTRPYEVLCKEQNLSINYLKEVLC